MTKRKEQTMTARTEINMTRATEAMAALTKATTDEERLAAAKALESAACQLRRELKKVTGAAA
jgi:hypothetical protein